MNIYIDVPVKFSAGAYTARIHKCRASSTMDAETAVRHAAEKYLAHGTLVLLDIEQSAPEVFGVAQYRVTIGDRQEGAK